MDIRNATQFTSFISDNELSKLDPLFQQIMICIGDFSRHCDCHKRGDKDAIYQNCNQLYLHAARIAAGKFKNEFLNKISDRQLSFYADNGSIISVATR